MKKSLIAIIVVVILVVVGYFIYQSSRGEESSQSTSTSGSASANPEPISTTKPGAVAILFYGQGCPHCQKVEDWLKENKVAEKVVYDNLEVWYNKDNSKVLSEKAKVCGIAEDKVGVPFLFDTVNNKCFVGEVEVQNFFKSKL